MQDTIELSPKHTLLHRIFPFLNWMPELMLWGNLRADLVAGFTVAMLSIPTSMAYAHLAGLPVYMGLYAAFIPPIIAALFGSSRILSTGPVPVASLLTAVAMQPLAAIGTSDYLQYVVLLTFMAGVIQFGLGLLRVGIVINFISYPVILGFINGVAIIIASMQLGNLFGVSAVSAPHYYQTVWQVIKDSISTPHWPTIMMTTLAFLIIFIGRRLKPKWPHILLAVAVTTTVSWMVGYEKLETIQINQIANPSVQKMLQSYADYPQQMKLLLNVVAKTRQTLSETIKKDGAIATKTDDAINNANLAKWELSRRASRHNLESGELNRLRFRRIITPDKQVVFYVNEQMSPIGSIDAHLWRIAVLPQQGTLTLQSGGDVVGNIPRGLPAFKPVAISFKTLTDLLMPALIIALLGFTEAITIAKRIANENRQFLNVNQELLGQGLAKLIGSFFQSMPVSGGFTRSAVNFQAGARTGFSSIVSGLMVMFILLWFTSLFYYLPYATLAVVIMVGVLGLLDVKEMWQVWQVSRHEGLVVLTTFVFTLLLAPNLAWAVIFGVLISLCVYLYETMHPHFCELKLNEEQHLIEITHPDQENTCRLVAAVRFNGSLYFANAAYFEEKIQKIISTKKELRYIILDCSRMNKLDTTGVQALNTVCARLKDLGFELWFTRVRPPVLDVLKRSGIFDQVGPEHFYKNNDEALAAVAIKLGEKHMRNCPLALTATHKN